MKKLNRILALIMAVIVMHSSGFSVAQAAVFDWVSGSAGKTSGNLALSLVSSYFNRGNPIDVKNESDNSDDMTITKNISTANITATQNTSSIVNEIIVAATAYSSTPDQTDDTPFITALGTMVRDGIIATNFLPFGTKVKIPDIYGDKIFVVEDRMNRRFRQRIDIWFPDRASALEFGIKRVKIQILES